MSNETFTAIKELLAAYAKHFKVNDNTDERYVLDEELEYSRTMFGFLHVSRGGARLIFYPLNVFPELHAGLPASLASKIKSKYVLSFETVTAAERKALAKLFAAGWACILARRKLVGRDRGYYRPIDRETTFDIVQRLVAKHPRATVTLQKSHVTVVLPDSPKLPTLLTTLETKQGVLKLKTITPAQYAALESVLARTQRK